LKKHTMVTSLSPGSGQSDAPAQQTVIEIRKGQAPAAPERAEFGVRYRAAYIDPAFRTEDASIARLEEIAWQAFIGGRKAPFTAKAGPGYADPDYDLSVEWIATKARIDAAQKAWARPRHPLAGLAGVWLCAQRWHLPGRDVQKFPAAGPGPRNAGAGRHSARCAGPEPADVGVRPPDPSLEEARKVARAVAWAVVELRAGRLQAAQPGLSRPRPK
jgi:hypothetical protein